VATLLGVPSIGISYRPKVQRFFDQINLSNYCLEFNDLGSLESLINEVYYNYSDVSKAFFTAGNSLINKKNEYKKLVEKYIQ
jgi:polysaccharide pyruvyl transferase WcaK-like protein